MTELLNKDNLDYVVEVGVRDRTTKNGAAVVEDTAWTAALAAARAIEAIDQCQMTAIALLYKQILPAMREGFENVPEQDDVDGFGYMD